MSKRYLITGGTGFIGSAIVKRLVEEENFVRIVDNNIRGDLRKVQDVLDRVELVEADVRDYDKINEVCKDIDSVIHLAYINGTEYFYSKPKLVLDVAIKGMINLMDACYNNNIKEFILASSSEVYQTPPVIPTPENVPLIIPDINNPRYSYGGGKIACELIAMNYGREFFDKVLIFRPHNVYGPDMGWEHVIPQFIERTLEKVKNSSEGDVIDFEIQGTGEETRAFIYIDDFVDGVIDMIEKGDHLNIYHIGNPNEIKIKQLVEEIVFKFDRRLNLINTELLAGSTLRRCPNIDKLKQIGFNPAITLKDGLSKTIDWYVNNINLKQGIK